MKEIKRVENLEKELIKQLKFNKFISIMLIVAFIHILVIVITK